MIGNETRVKVVKNKVSPPFREAIFDILYGEGTSREGEIIELGVAHKLVDKSGAWYAYKGEKIGQGRDKPASSSSQPAIAEEIEARVREAVGWSPAAARCCHRPDRWMSCASAPCACWRGGVFAGRAEEEARPHAESEEQLERLDALLDDLAGRRLLSDARYAEMRVSSRSARYGNARLAQELKQQRGLGRNDCAGALEEAGDELRAPTGFGPGSSVYCR